MLQSLAVTEIKGIADSLLRRVDNADGSASLIPTAESEAVRTALQGLVGCAGAAAGGGDCGSAATGAAASVVINNLISAIDTGFEEPRYDPITGELLNPTALEDQQARTNLVAALVGAIAEGAGLDTPDAVTAAQIETENNQLAGISVNVCGKGKQQGCLPEAEARELWLADPTIQDIIEQTGITPAQAWECLRGRLNCDAEINAYKDRVIDDLNNNGGLSAEEEAAIRSAPVTALPELIQNVENEQQQRKLLNDINESEDPFVQKFASRLSQQSEPVQHVAKRDVRQIKSRPGATATPPRSLSICEAYAAKPP